MNNSQCLHFTECKDISRHARTFWRKEKRCFDDKKVSKVQWILRQHKRDFNTWSGCLWDWTKAWCLGFSQNSRVIRIMLEHFGSDRNSVLITKKFLMCNEFGHSINVTLILDQVTYQNEPNVDASAFHRIHSQFTEC